MGIKTELLIDTDLERNRQTRDYKKNTNIYF